MSDISETYNRAHNILELVDIFLIFFSKQLKWKAIFANKNGKYELNDKLPNDLRLKKISWNYCLV